MSAAVARSHGGDAGGDPPPGPRRIPTTCEGLKKKGRGRSTGMSLHQALSRNGNRPLPIEFEFQDQETYMPVGDNYKHFSRCIGNWIGSYVPMYYEGWNRVPAQHKVGLYSELEHYFDLRPHREGRHWASICEGIDQICRARYRDRKSKRKDHFEKYPNVEEARRHPPDNILPEEWDKTIAHYLDPKHKRRAEVNSQNRSKAPYPSLHGSRSYASVRHKKKNPDTQQYPSLLQTFSDMHSKNGEWVNDRAYTAYEKLVETRASSSSSVTDAEIFSKVLGERRGHNRGRGRKLKSVASSSMFQESQHATQRRNDDVVRAMDAKFAALAAHTNASLQTLLEVLRRNNPNVTFPDIPGFDISLASSSSSLPQENSNDSDDEDLRDD